MLLIIDKRSQQHQCLTHYSKFLHELSLCSWKQINEVDPNSSFLDQKSEAQKILNIISYKWISDIKQIKYLNYICVYIYIYVIVLGQRFANVSKDPFVFQDIYIPSYAWVLKCFFIVVQAQFSAFSPHPSPPP